MSLALQQPGASRPSVPVSAWPVPTQLALSLLLTAGVFFLLGRWTHDRSEPSPARESEGPRLDVNRATRAELRLLPGVGDGLARRIVDHRNQHGPFQTVDDLRRVSGVGPKTLTRLRPWLLISDDPSDSPPPPMLASDDPAPKPPVIASKKVPPPSAIDINLADAPELQKLPGIGPKMSQRILDERTLRGPFKSIDELRRVPGIGVKTLDRLRPHVTISPAPAASIAAYNK